VDQGRQAGSEDDALELPSLPVERSAAVAERDRLQSGEPVAVAGGAEANRQGSLTSLQQRLLKTGGRLVRHARYYWLLLAESHLTRRLFASMVRRIELLPLPAG